jgi:hypothetical protein
MATAKIQLQLVDVLGRPLDDPDILVEFFSNESSKHFRLNVSPNGAANVNFNLVDPGNGMYRVLLMPTNYRTIQFFLRIMENEITTRKPVIFPVDPAKVVNITAPAIDALPRPLQDLLGKATVDGFTDAAGAPLQGAALYNALPPLPKAALLNLYTKSAAVQLGDGQSAFDKLGTMVRLKQDRLFAKTSAALLEETQQDTFFHQVPETLHESVAPYRLVISYKTRDAQGNLQLTFSRNGDSGDDYLVDMDIDQAQGIGHIFEVLQNAVTSGLTNPYDVREILVADQKLQPLYGFKFAARGASAAAVSAG